MEIMVQNSGPFVVHSVDVKETKVGFFSTGYRSWNFE